MPSLWKQIPPSPPRPTLPGDLTADAAVVGAGLAGVLIARELQRRGLHTVVLEARTLGSGQTGNTTAKLTAQHGMVYRQLIRRFGREKAGQYARANLQGVEHLCRMVREEEISCDLTVCPSYLYSRSQAAPLLEEAEACASLGLPAKFTSKTSLPFPITGAVRMGHQAVFHPLKFLFSAARPLELYEHTPVLSAAEDQLVTPTGRVTARHIIFACHYPFVNFPGLYFARMHQERSYVAAVTGIPPLDGSYYSIDPGGLSLRSAGEYLLVGGGGHRTGKNNRGGQYRMLEASAGELWPGCTPALRWSAQDCMTLDGVPYIGVFSPTRPRWYVATGFQKWGMSTSMAAAGIIADQVEGIANPLAEVFSPRRFSSTAALNLAKEGANSAVNLARANLGRADLTPEDLPAGHGAIVDLQGKKMGAYRDPEGTLHLINPRCPHLGCLLRWNPEERTWDCPCHGSRFRYDGTLIDNPAQTGL